MKRRGNFRRNEDVFRTFYAEAEYFFPDFFNQPAKINDKVAGRAGRVNVRHAGSRCRGLLIHLVPPTMSVYPAVDVFAAWPSRDSRFTV